MSEQNKNFSSTSDYVASEQLLASVNVAIALQKPLLVKGEPGTGKTMLAQAIANSLGKKLIIWNIKSTTKAQDGLYLYDTIQRLYDGQFGEEGVNDIARYIKLGKLGEAFESEEQVILLIDEIDKADLEFPNDLLWELPDAFLRRCIFHYIDFPDQTLMEEIVRTHYPEVEDKLLKDAMEAFYWIRSMKDIRKKPSTSELIDWINALQIGGIPTDKLRAELPFIGVVVKKDEDLETVKNRREF